MVGPEGGTRMANRCDEIWQEQKDVLHTYEVFQRLIIHHDMDWQFEIRTISEFDDELMSNGGKERKIKDFHGFAFGFAWPSR